MPSTPQTRSQRPRTYPTDPSSSAGPSHKARPVEQRDPTGLPGISKIKASIRQTNRLLAKVPFSPATRDTLEPGLRIATQRRLTSLQADLRRAERREVEKKNGGKYHMVKFFERQKLTRQIKRLRKQLSNASPNASALTLELDDARLMLNYVIHYPNEKKYIALFPSTGQVKVPAPGEQVAMEGLEKTERMRMGMLLEIRGMMERGEMSREPEEGGAGRQKGAAMIGRRVGLEDEAGSSPDGKSGKKEKGKPGLKTAEQEDEGEDEFFESD